VGGFAGSTTTKEKRESTRDRDGTILVPDSVNTATRVAVGSFVEVAPGISVAVSVDAVVEGLPVNELVTDERLPVSIVLEGMSFAFTSGSTATCDNDTCGKDSDGNEKAPPACLIKFPVASTFGRAYAGNKNDTQKGGLIHALRIVSGNPSAP
jgi:hypothetical protein